MIRAAMVGIGRWGRTLFSSVHGRSSAIRASARHTRAEELAHAVAASEAIVRSAPLIQPVKVAQCR